MPKKQKKPLRKKLSSSQLAALDKQALQERRRRASKGKISTGVTRPRRAVEIEERASGASMFVRQVAKKQGRKKAKKKR